MVALGAVLVEQSELFAWRRWVKKGRFIMKYGCLKRTEESDGGKGRYPERWPAGGICLPLQSLPTDWTSLAVGPC